MVLCSSFLCCFDEDSAQKRRWVGTFDKTEDEVVSAGGTFGIIHSVTTKFDISRCGPEHEVHTKVIDVPSPFKTHVQIDDVLEPSRYLHLAFEDIHDSHYIGINQIAFKDAEGNEVPYENIEVDGQQVDHDQVKAAFPPNGWWAVCGGDHSLLFDFGEKMHVKEIYVMCTNSASTPKIMKVSDSKRPTMNTGDKYDAAFFFQLAGDTEYDPNETDFAGDAGSKISCKQVIESLNTTNPENCFKSFISYSGESHFVFYEKGKRVSAYNYYFGAEPSLAIDLINSIKPHEEEIDDVALRALSLAELQGIRAIIMSKCVKEGWKSSKDGRKLRPEDVNLYDLNKSLIMPLTKDRNCAFKELFTSGASKPTYYVSHWWGESVLDFIRCCEYHAERYGLSAVEATYWVCAHANRQHDLGTDLGNDPAQSSFNRAMGLAKGVLLVCDIEAVVTSRIWVDYELYRTVRMNAGLDVVIHANGSPHLIAAEPLPNESPYQKNKREKDFPFEAVCNKLLSVKLQDGDSSEPIDKIRILNTMIDNKPLDSKGVLERVEKNDTKDNKYINDLNLFSQSNAALRAEMACKSVSVALSTDGQNYDNFFGFDLLKIIAKDKLRESIVLNDLTGLDSVTDSVLCTLIKLAGPSVKRFEIDVKGCRNITNKAIRLISFPPTLQLLSLNFGYAKNITNDALIKLMKKIPTSLQCLDLDVCGFKDPAGKYLPERYSTLLVELSKNLPSELTQLKFVSTLDDEDGGVNGLAKLLETLPSSLKSLSFKFEQWDNFKGHMIVEIFKSLPSTLEEFSITIYNGDHIEDDDLRMAAKQIQRLDHLKDLSLHSRSHGNYGYYKVRDFHSVSEVLSFAE